MGFLQTGTGALVSVGIGTFGASSIVALLSGTAATALAVLLLGRPYIASMVMNHDAETVVMH